jgi:cell division protein FtsX
LYGVPLELVHLAWADSLFALLFAAGLGWFGAWLSVRRHLSTHNPS